MAQISINNIVRGLILGLLTSLLFLSISSPVFADDSSRVMIKGGQFAPLYGLKPGQKSFRVKDFLIDITPVTNRKFFDFVLSHPDWKKGAPLAILADANYLDLWKEDPDRQGESSPPVGLLDSPVVFVSWFAANEYCVSHGGRLPTVLEWEYAGAASDVKPNASRDPVFVEQLLAWYSTSSTDKLPKVGQGKPNYYGLYDMHGMVWEWVMDFNSVFVAGDNRREADEIKNLFCGPGALGAADRANYAAFMRYALRNSLKGAYSTKNLGFRCAYDVRRK